MVGACCEVMSALRLGRSAMSSAKRAKSASRSACRLRKVSTEWARSLLRPRLTWLATVRCTMSKETAVRPADVNSMTMRTLVRNRHRLIAVSCTRSPDEFIPGAVDGTEMYRIGGVLFQLLSQPQDVGVNGARSGIVVIAPHFVQQLGARDHALRIVEEKAQRLEFLRGERHQLAATMQFHFGEIHFDVIEAENLHL